VHVICWLFTLLARFRVRVPGCPPNQYGIPFKGCHIFSRHLERWPVTLSAAKGLASWAARSFAELRMTTRTPLKSTHWKPYLQISDFFLVALTTGFVPGII